MTRTAGLVGDMLTMMLNQRLELGPAGIEHTGKIERNIGVVVGIGAAKFVRPVVKELPLVCASFRNLDGNSVHINSTR